MLHGHLCGIFQLIDAHFKQLAKGGGSHAAGGADLCLTAAGGAADGGICADDVADETRHRKGADDIMIGELVFILHIFQHRGHHAAGAAGGSGDDDAAVGILLADGKGIGADEAVFSGLGAFVDVLLIIQELGLSLQCQSAGKLSGLDQTLLDGIQHGLPHLK